MKVHRKEVVNRLRMSLARFRALRMADDFPPSGRDKEGHYWLSGPALTAFIREHRRPPRKK